MNNIGRTKLLHAKIKFQGHQSTCAWEEKFWRVLPSGLGGHVVHVTWLILLEQNVCSVSFWRLYRKFGYNWPSVFWDDTWDCHTMRGPSQRSKNDSYRTFRQKSLELSMKSHVLEFSNIWPCLKRVKVAKGHHFNNFGSTLVPMLHTKFQAFGKLDLQQKIFRCFLFSFLYYSCVCVCFSVLVQIKFGIIITHFLFSEHICVAYTKALQSRWAPPMTLQQFLPFQSAYLPLPGSCFQLPIKFLPTLFCLPFLLSFILLCHAE